MISFACSLTRGEFTLDCAFESGKGVLALFGASGSGKTTILRLIAGLERPDRGTIVVDGHVLLDTARHIDVPTHRRRIGLVFQDGQLLPHLSVAQNLRYGQHFARSPAIVAFDRAVSMLGLDRLLDRNPRTLSGGERQRVAIGRALLAAPGILLMDEPLASLDAERKVEILPFVERLRDEVKLPIVYVSHSMGEVARLASDVVKIRDGRVVAQGAPDTVLLPTMDDGTRRFEAISLLKGRVARRLSEYKVTVLEHPAGEIVLPGLTPHDKGAEVGFVVHATNVALSLRRPSGLSVRTLLTGRVANVDLGVGPLALVSVELTGGDRIYAFVTRLALAELAIAPGMPIFALVKAVSIDELGVSARTSL